MGFFRQIGGIFGGGGRVGGGLARGGVGVGGLGVGVGERRRQRGFVHIIFLVFIVLGVALWGISATLERLHEGEDRVAVDTRQSLEEARRALVEYTIIPPRGQGPAGDALYFQAAPGGNIVWPDGPVELSVAYSRGFTEFYLPCPDNAGDDNFDGVFDLDGYGCGYSFDAATGFTSANSLGVGEAAARGSRLGRLPWRERNDGAAFYVRGLAAGDPRDGFGGRLWYAVARELVRSDVPHNPHRMARLSRAAGDALLRVEDPDGELVSDRVAAVIIAPGLGPSEDTVYQHLDEYADGPVGGFDPDDAARFIGINATDATVSVSGVFRQSPPLSFDAGSADEFIGNRDPATRGITAPDGTVAVDETAFLDIDELIRGPADFEDKGTLPIRLLEDPDSPFYIYDRVGDNPFGRAGGESGANYLDAVEALLNFYERNGYFPEPALFDERHGDSVERLWMPYPTAEGAATITLNGGEELATTGSRYGGGILERTSFTVSVANLSLNTPPGLPTHTFMARITDDYGCDFVASAFRNLEVTLFLDRENVITIADYPSPHLSFRRRADGTQETTVCPAGAEFTISITDGTFDGFNSGYKLVSEDGFLPAGLDIDGHPVERMAVPRDLHVVITNFAYYASGGFSCLQNPTARPDDPLFVEPAEREVVTTTMTVSGVETITTTTLQIRDSDLYILHHNRDRAPAPPAGGRPVDAGSGYVPRVGDDQLCQNRAPHDALATSPVTLTAFIGTVPPLYVNVGDMPEAYIAAPITVGNELRGVFAGNRADPPYNARIANLQDNLRNYPIKDYWCCPDQSPEEFAVFPRPGGNPELLTAAIRVTVDGGFSVRISAPVHTSPQGPVESYINCLEERWSGFDTIPADAQAACLENYLQGTPAGGVGVLAPPGSLVEIPKTVTVNLNEFNVNAIFFFPAGATLNLEDLPGSDRRLYPPEFALAVGITLSPVAAGVPVVPSPPLRLAEFGEGAPAVSAPVGFFPAGRLASSPAEGVEVTVWEDNYELHLGDAFYAAKFPGAVTLVRDFDPTSESGMMIQPHSPGGWHDGNFIQVETGGGLTLRRPNIAGARYGNFIWPTAFTVGDALQPIGVATDPYRQTVVVEAGAEFLLPPGAVLSLGGNFSFPDETVVMLPAGQRVAYTDYPTAAGARFPDGRETNGDRRQTDILLPLGGALFLNGGARIGRLASGEAPAEVAAFELQIDSPANVINPATSVTVAVIGERRTAGIALPLLQRYLRPADLRVEDGDVLVGHSRTRARFLAAPLTYRAHGFASDLTLITGRDACLASELCFDDVDPFTRLETHIITVASPFFLRGEDYALRDEFGELIVALPGGEPLPELQAPIDERMELLIPPQTNLSIIYSPVTLSGALLSVLTNINTSVTTDSGGNPVTLTLRAQAEIANAVVTMTLPSDVVLPPDTGIYSPAFAADLAFGRLAYLRSELTLELNVFYQYGEPTPATTVTLLEVEAGVTMTTEIVEAGEPPLEQSDREIFFETSSLEQLSDQTFSRCDIDPRANPEPIAFPLVYFPQGTVPGPVLATLGGVEVTTGAIGDTVTIEGEEYRVVARTAGDVCYEPGTTEPANYPAAIGGGANPSAGTVAPECPLSYRIAFLPPPFTNSAGFCTRNATAGQPNPFSVPQSAIIGRGYVEPSTNFTVEFNRRPAVTIRALSFDREVLDDRPPVRDVLGAALVLTLRAGEVNPNDGSRIPSEVVVGTPPRTVGVNTTVITVPDGTNGYWQQDGPTITIGYRYFPTATGSPCLNAACNEFAPLVEVTPSMPFVRYPTLTVATNVYPEGLRGLGVQARRLALFPDTDMRLIKTGEDGTSKITLKIAGGSMVDIAEGGVTPPLLRRDFRAIAEDSRISFNGPLVALVRRDFRLAPSPWAFTVGAGDLDADNAVWAWNVADPANVAAQASVLIEDPICNPEPVDPGISPPPPPDAEECPPFTTLLDGDGMLLPAGSFLYMPGGHRLSILAGGHLGGGALPGVFDSMQLPPGAMAFVPSGATVTIGAAVRPLEQIYDLEDTHPNQTAGTVNIVGPAVVDISGRYVRLFDADQIRWMSDYGTAVTAYLESFDPGRAPFHSAFSGAAVREADNALVRTIGADSRLDLLGNLSETGIARPYAELLSPDTASFLENYPLIYAVAEECRRHRSGGLAGSPLAGDSCAEDFGEGLTVVVEERESVNLSSDTIAPPGVLIVAAGLEPGTVDLNLRYERDAIGPQPAQDAVVVTVTATAPTVYPCHPDPGYGRPCNPTDPAAGNITLARGEAATLTISIAVPAQPAQTATTATITGKRFIALSDDGQIVQGTFGGLDQIETPSGSFLTDITIRKDFNERMVVSPPAVAYLYAVSVDIADRRVHLSHPAADSHPLSSLAEAVQVTIEAPLTIHAGGYVRVGRRGAGEIYTGTGLVPTRPAGAIRAETGGSFFIGAGADLAATSPGARIFGSGGHMVVRGATVTLDDYRILEVGQYRITAFGGILTVDARGVPEPVDDGEILILGRAATSETSFFVNSDLTTLEMEPGYVWNGYLNGLNTLTYLRERPPDGFLSPTYSWDFATLTMLIDDMAATATLSKVEAEDYLAHLGLTPLEADYTVRLRGLTAAVAQSAVRDRAALVSLLAPRVLHPLSGLRARPVLLSSLLTPAGPNAGPYAPQFPVTDPRYPGNSEWFGRFDTLRHPSHPMGYYEFHDGGQATRLGLEQGNGTFRTGMYFRPYPNFPTGNFPWHGGVHPTDIMTGTQVPLTLALQEHIDNLPDTAIPAARGVPGQSFFIDPDTGLPLEKIGQGEGRRPGTIPLITFAGSQAPLYISVTVGIQSPGPGFSITVDLRDMSAVLDVLGCEYQRINGVCSGRLEAVSVSLDFADESAINPDFDPLAPDFNLSPAELTGPRCAGGVDPRALGPCRDGFALGDACSNAVEAVGYIPSCRDPSYPDVATANAPGDPALPLVDGLRCTDGSRADFIPSCLDPFESEGVDDNYCVPDSPNFVPDCFFNICAATGHSQYVGACNPNNRPTQPPVPASTATIYVAATLGFYFDYARPYTTTVQFVDSGGRVTNEEREVYIADDAEAIIRSDILSRYPLFPDDAILPNTPNPDYDPDADADDVGIDDQQFLTPGYGGGYGRYGVFPGEAEFEVPLYFLPPSDPLTLLAQRLEPHENLAAYDHFVRDQTVNIQIVGERLTDRSHSGNSLKLLPLSAIPSSLSVVGEAVTVDFGRGGVGQRFDEVEYEGIVDGFNGGVPAAMALYLAMGGDDLIRDIRDVQFLIDNRIDRLDPSDCLDRFTDVAAAIECAERFREHKGRAVGGDPEGLWPDDQKREYIVRLKQAFYEQPVEITREDEDGNIYYDSAITLTVREAGDFQVFGDGSAASGMPPLNLPTLSIAYFFPVEAGLDGYTFPLRQLLDLGGDDDSHGKHHIAGTEPTTIQPNPSGITALPINVNGLPRETLRLPMISITLVVIGGQDSLNRSFSARVLGDGRVRTVLPTDPVNGWIPVGADASATPTAGFDGWRDFLANCELINTAGRNSFGDDIIVTGEVFPGSVPNVINGVSRANPANNIGWICLAQHRDGGTSFITIQNGISSEAPARAHIESTGVNPGTLVGHPRRIGLPNLRLMDVVGFGPYDEADLLDTSTSYTYHRVELAMPSGVYADDWPAGRELDGGIFKDMGLEVTVTVADIPLDIPGGMGFANVVSSLGMDNRGGERISDIFPLRLNDDAIITSGGLGAEITMRLSAQTRDLAPLEFAGYMLPVPLGRLLDSMSRSARDDILLPGADAGDTGGGLPITMAINGLPPQLQLTLAKPWVTRNNPIEIRVGGYWFDRTDTGTLKDLARGVAANQIAPLIIRGTRSLANLDVGFGVYPTGAADPPQSTLFVAGDNPAVSITMNSGLINRTTGAPASIDGADGWFLADRYDPREIDGATLTVVRTPGILRGLGLTHITIPGEVQGRAVVQEASISVFGPGRPFTVQIVGYTYGDPSDPAATPVATGEREIGRLSEMLAKILRINRSDVSVVMPLNRDLIVPNPDEPSEVRLAEDFAITMRMFDPGGIITTAITLSPNAFERAPPLYPNTKRGGIYLRAEPQQRLTIFVPEISGDVFVRFDWDGTPDAKYASGVTVRLSRIRDTGSFRTDIRSNGESSWVNNRFFYQEGDIADTGGMVVRTDVPGYKRIPLRRTGATPGAVNLGGMVAYSPDIPPNYQITINADELAAHVLALPDAEVGAIDLRFDRLVATITAFRPRYATPITPLGQSADGSTPTAAADVVFDNENPLLLEVEYRNCSATTYELAEAMWLLWFSNNIWDNRITRPRIPVDDILVSGSGVANSAYQLSPGYDASDGDFQNFKGSRGYQPSPYTDLVGAEGDGVTSWSSEVLTGAAIFSPRLPSHLPHRYSTPPLHPSRDLIRRALESLPANGDYDGNGTPDKDQYASCFSPPVVSNETTIPAYKSVGDIPAAISTAINMQVDLFYDTAGARNPGRIDEIRNIHLNNFIRDFSPNSCSAMVYFREYNDHDNDDYDEDTDDPVENHALFAEGLSLRFKIARGSGAHPDTKITLTGINDDGEFCASCFHIGTVGRLASPPDGAGVLPDGVFAAARQPFVNNHHNGESQGGFGGTDIRTGGFFHLNDGRPRIDDTILGTSPPLPTPPPPGPTARGSFDDYFALGTRPARAIIPGLQNYENRAGRDRDNARGDWPNCRTGSITVSYHPPTPVRARAEPPLPEAKITVKITAKANHFVTQHGHYEGENNAEDNGGNRLFGRFVRQTGAIASDLDGDGESDSIYRTYDTIEEMLGDLVTISITYPDIGRRWIGEPSGGDFHFCEAFTAHDPARGRNFGGHDTPEAKRWRWENETHAALTLNIGAALNVTAYTGNTNPRAIFTKPITLGYETNNARGYQVVQDYRDRSTRKYDFHFDHPILPPRLNQMTVSTPVKVDYFGPQQVGPLKNIVTADAQVVISRIPDPTKAGREKQRLPFGDNFSIEGYAAVQPPIGGEQPDPASNLPNFPRRSQPRNAGSYFHDFVYSGGRFDVFFRNTHRYLKEATFPLSDRLRVNLWTEMKRPRSTSPDGLAATTASVTAVIHPGSTAASITVTLAQETKVFTDWFRRADPDEGGGVGVPTGGEPTAQNDAYGFRVGDFNNDQIYDWIKGVYPSDPNFGYRLIRPHRECQLDRDSVDQAQINRYPGANQIVGNEWFKNRIAFLQPERDEVSLIRLTTPWNRGMFGTFCRGEDDACNAGRGRPEDYSTEALGRDVGPGPDCNSEADDIHATERHILNTSAYMIEAGYLKPETGRNIEFLMPQPWATVSRIDPNTDTSAPQVILAGSIVRPGEGHIVPAVPFPSAGILRIAPRAAIAALGGGNAHVPVPIIEVINNPKITLFRQMPGAVGPGLPGEPGTGRLGAASRKIGEPNACRPLAHRGCNNPRTPIGHIDPSPDPNEGDGITEELRVGQLMDFRTYGGGHNCGDSHDRTYTNDRTPEWYVIDGGGRDESDTDEVNHNGDDHDDYAFRRALEDRITIEIEITGFALTVTAGFDSALADGWLVRDARRGIQKQTITPYPNVLGAQVEQVVADANAFPLRYGHAFTFFSGSRLTIFPNYYSAFQKAEKLDRVNINDAWPSSGVLHHPPASAGGDVVLQTLAAPVYPLPTNGHIRSFGAAFGACYINPRGEADVGFEQGLIDTEHTAFEPEGPGCFMSRRWYLSRRPYRWEGRERRTRGRRRFEDYMMGVHDVRTINSGYFHTHALVPRTQRTWPDELRVGGNPVNRGVPLDLRTAKRFNPPKALREDGTEAIINPDYRAFDDVPIRQNLWVRLQSPAIFTGIDGMQLTLDTGYIVNPIQGTYVNPNADTPNSLPRTKTAVVTPAFVPPLIEFNNIPLGNLPLRAARPALTFPRGSPVFAPKGGRFQNVQAALFYSLYPLNRTECYEDFGTTRGTGDFVNISQITEGVPDADDPGRFITDRTASGNIAGRPGQPRIDVNAVERVSTGHPCIYLDDAENTDNDAEFIYRGATRYNKDGKVISNDRTFLVGGEFVPDT